MSKLSTESMFQKAIFEINNNNYLSAIDLLNELLATDKNNIILLYNIALSYQNIKEFNKSIYIYNKLINKGVNSPDIYNNWGNIYKEIGEFDNAIKKYKNAIDIAPGYFLAYNNLGSINRKIKNYGESIKNYKICVELNNSYSDGYKNLGNLYFELKQTDIAETNINKAISLNPNDCENFISLGYIHATKNELEKSYINFKKAYKLNPKYEYLFGNLLHAKMKICEWDNLNIEVEELHQELITGEYNIILPFVSLGIFDDPALHQKIATNYSLQYQKNFDESKNKELRIFDKRKIRIGYFSADFHNHATSQLIAQLFELHNKAKFEIYGFSFGFSNEDEMKNRIRQSLNELYDVSEFDDEKVISLVKNLHIDIAIDLKGYTGDSRVGIFSGRCAPIQIQYLGYPGTLGNSFMDYVIADKIVIPPDQHKYYSEKIIYLPNCYQVNDNTKIINTIDQTKKDFGLPDNGFIFCCFNNHYKIHPDVFTSWMKILSVVEASVLWLIESDPISSFNLKKSAKKNGIDESRIIFAKKMDLNDHLGRHKFADLFLDTFPYNAHTTASDALWSGLPVLTRTGKSFASRVGASLLNAMDLNELITTSLTEYENMAIKLASDKKYFNFIKSKLKNNLDNCALFDSKLFVKDIENIYSEVYKEHT
jgi:protein O-GlcNAc transferase